MLAVATLMSPTTPNVVVTATQSGCHQTIFECPTTLLQFVPNVTTTVMSAANATTNASINDTAAGEHASTTLVPLGVGLTPDRPDFGGGTPDFRVESPDYGKGTPDYGRPSSGDAGWTPDYTEATPDDAVNDMHITAEVVSDDATSEEASTAESTSFPSKSTASSPADSTSMPAESTTSSPAESITRSPAESTTSSSVESTKILFAEFTAGPFSEFTASSFTESTADEFAESTATSWSSTTGASDGRPIATERRRTKRATSPVERLNATHCIRSDCPVRKPSSGVTETPYGHQVSSKYSFKPFLYYS